MQYNSTNLKTIEAEHHIFKEKSWTKLQFIFNSFRIYAEVFTQERYDIFSKESIYTIKFRNKIIELSINDIFLNDILLSAIKNNEISNHQLFIDEENLLSGVISMFIKEYRTAPAIHYEQSISKQIQILKESGYEWFKLEYIENLLNNLKNI